MSSAAVFCFCLSLAGLVQAQTYKVGVQSLDYFPIAAAAPPDHVFKGYAREVLDRFAQREGIRFDYVALPPRRMFIEYWAGKLDFAFPDNPNWDTEEKTKYPTLAYSQPLLRFYDAVFTVPEKAEAPAAQLKKLGVLLGWTPWKFSERIEEGAIQLQTAPNPHSLIQMAISGRVDGANLAEPVARYHLRLRGTPDALMANLEWMPQRQSTYHLSSIRHSDLLKRFDQYLREDDAHLARLRSKYGL
ncbi:substrate-binding periplasmic protein [Pseudoduganella sp. OTU4001]|uniref:substrate-binding periplasmic protein n=1 Tax=Pseudoduganella sp. OTU4001 TaxID=3043854 RepID=UPI00313C0D0F